MLHTHASSFSQQCIPGGEAAGGAAPALASSVEAAAADAAGPSLVLLLTVVAGSGVGCALAAAGACVPITVASAACDAMTVGAAETYEEEVGVAFPVSAAGGVELCCEASDIASVVTADTVLGRGVSAPAVSAGAVLCAPPAALVGAMVPSPTDVASSVPAEVLANVGVADSLGASI